MATLANIRTAIQGFLDDSDSQIAPNDSQVNLAINSAINYYSSNALWFTEELTDLITTVDDNILGGIPSDFKQGIEPNTLILKENSEAYLIKKVNPMIYDLRFNGSTGRPYWFTYRAGNFELYPIPDQVYTVALFYRKKYEDLSEDSDTNDFTENAERLITYKALADILLDYRQDSQRSAIYEAKAKDEYRQLKRESYERTATGKLTIKNLAQMSRRSNPIYVG